MRRERLYWVLTMAVAFCFVLATGMTPGIASENYPGKWYGWHCPYFGLESQEMATPQGWAHPEQKILNSWGYKGNDAEEIKDLLPQMFYEMVKSPEVWGKIRVNETAYVTRTGEYMDRLNAATEKYKGQPNIDEKNHMRNYNAGIPFPESENGVEIAWNFNKRAYFGDCIRSYTLLNTVNRAGQSRGSIMYLINFFFNGRLFGEQSPRWEPNPNNTDSIQTGAWRHPYNLRGMIQVTQRYDDPKKDDDQWMYLPGLRRIRRMSTSQRWDRLPGGSPAMFDMLAGFSGKVTNYEWNYLGRKELLAGHNSSVVVQMLKDKPGAPPDQYYQRINTVSYEFIPKPHMHAPVLKMILSVDPETYVLYYTELFDKKGRPWIITGNWVSWDSLGSACGTSMLVADIQRITTGHPIVCGLEFSYDIAELDNPEFHDIQQLMAFYGSR